MVRVVFKEPSGSKTENPSIDHLRQLILAPPDDYWRRGTGGATLEYIDEFSNNKMLILPNELLGYYLKYINGSEYEWISLEDPSKLSEVAECADEWFASIGLFLPKQKAWIAIEEFCRTGARTNQIDWITPSDLPEGGNC